MESASDKPHVVLHVYRRYNKLQTNFNADNFQSYDKTIIFRSVFNAIGTFIFYLCLFLVFAINFYYLCFDKLADLNQRVYQICATTIMSQHFSMAMVFLLENRQVYVTFDRIQESMVKSRTTVFLIFYF